MNVFLYEDQASRMNKQAIDEIKQGRTDKALGILRNALVVVKRINEDPPKSRVLSQIFHTFGNLFKRCENFEESLKFFEKCAVLESSLREEEKGYIAMAYLNTATVYSLLSNHTLAIKHGTYAITLMKKLVKIHPKMVNSLVIAYHNLAGEYKYTGDQQKAEQIFKVALNLSKDRLGPEHNLTQTVSKALQALTGARATRYKDYFTDFMAKDITKLPEVRAKRSSSDSRDYYHKYQAKPRKSDQSTFKPEQFNRSLYQVPYIKAKKYGLSDEGSTRTDKSLSTSNWNKKIDLQRHREIERNAAIVIQSFWRGFKTRKAVNELKLNKKLKQAEVKARKAMEDYENIKVQIMKLKKQANK